MKVDKSVAQKLKQYKIPKSDAQVSTSSAKNIAGARLEKLKQQLQTITERKYFEYPALLMIHKFDW